MKKLLPDLIAILAFVLISFAYFFPADMEGRILFQHDTAAGAGAGQEAKEYYEANPNKFKKEETVQAKHILVEDEDKCTDILNSIVSGEISFEEAAKQHSTCPSGQQGGDLGEFGHGQMVKEFDEAAFAAEPGKVVGPVKTQFGYHLIKVEDKKDAETSVYEDVADTIKNIILQQKRNDVYGNKIAELKEKYVEK